MEEYLAEKQPLVRNKVPEVKARGLWQKEMSTISQTRISHLQGEITALHSVINVAAQQSREALVARDKSKYHKATTDFYEIDKQITALDHRVRDSIPQSTTKPAAVPQLRKQAGC